MTTVQPLMAHPLTAHPLTVDRFADLEALFATESITRDCWCLWWRVAAKDWKTFDQQARHDAFAELVAAGPPPGVLLYAGDAAIGWVQATPRAAVPRFNRARSAKPAPADTDLDRVWVLSCFFLRKAAQGQGHMTTLARAGCAFAAERGAVAVEAAPLAPRRPLIWGEGYVGIRSALERVGFVEVEQRTELRALMRWTPAA